MSGLGFSGVTSGGSGVRFSHRPVDLGQGPNRQGVRYPNPFFDSAQTYFPARLKQMLRWCRYFFFTNPLINAVVYKLSEYPITEIMYDTDDEDVRQRYKALFEDQLQIRKFQIEVGLDYYNYGNAFITVKYPFVKHLKCVKCGHEKPIRELRNHYRFTDLKYYLTCPKCGERHPARVRDRTIKNSKGIRLIRWDPERIEIDDNDGVTDPIYYYDLPQKLRNSIVIGKRSVIEEVPDLFIEAVRKKRSVSFADGQLFHLKRPIIAQKDQGWGMPLVMPVLKDLFHMQIARKGQEMVLQDHIVPLRVLFPAAGSQTSDPATMVNLRQWRDDVQEELTRWRQDCVTPRTWVDTPEGLRIADDIGIGDTINDRYGNPETVEHILRRPLRVGECAYRIEARGLSAVDSVFSENHPFWAARKFNNGNGHKLGDPDFIDVKDLRVGDYVSFPVSTRVEHVEELDLAEYVTNACTDDWVYVDYHSPETPEAFECLSSQGPPEKRRVLLKERGWSVNQYKAAQNAIRQGRVLRRVARRIPMTAELAWVFGIYAAEGSATPKQVMFALHEKEQAFIDRLDRFFEQYFGAAGCTHRVTESGIQRIYSSTVAAAFFGNLCPGDARTKAVPSIFRYAPEELVVSFLGGYLDGDGCYHQDGTSHKFSAKTASLQLAEGLRQLFFRIYIPVGLTSIPSAAYVICGKHGMSAGGYQLQGNGPALDRMLALLDGEASEPILRTTIGLYRDGFFWHRIRKIEQVEAEEVIGFSVTGDSTFCTWGMATHNSNYVPVMPIPLGHEMIGGQGRALILHQELRFMAEQVIAGMNVPIEFIFGGLSFTGSNISMRILENQFIGYRIDQLRLVRDFIMGSVCEFLGWPHVGIKFRRFRMADDLQRLMIYFQANQAMKLSDTTFLRELGEELAVEEARKKDELAKQIQANRDLMVAQAAAQGESNLAMIRYEVQAQKLQAQMGQPPMGDQVPGQEEQAATMPAGLQGEQIAPGVPDQVTVYPENAQPEGLEQMVQSPMQQSQLGGMDIRYVAQRIAAATRQLQAENPHAAAQSLQRLQMGSPDLYRMVVQLLAEGDGGERNTLNPMQQPIPDQKPPRRDEGQALV